MRSSPRSREITLGTTAAILLLGSIACSSNISGQARGEGRTSLQGTTTSATAPASTEQAPPPLKNEATLDETVTTLGANIKALYNRPGADRGETTGAPELGTTYVVKLPRADGTQVLLSERATNAADPATINRIQAGQSGPSAANTFSFVFERRADGDWQAACIDSNHDVRADQNQLTLTSGEVVDNPLRAQLVRESMMRRAVDFLGEAVADESGPGVPNPIADFCAPFDR